MVYLTSNSRTELPQIELLSDKISSTFPAEITNLKSENTKHPLKKKPKANSLQNISITIETHQSPLHSPRPTIQ